MESSYDRIRYHRIESGQKSKIVAELKKIFAIDKRIQLALLFGSITRREYVRDIDVCVSTFEPLSFKELLDLNVKIELKLKLPVELVDLSVLPTNLKVKILEEGILLKGTRTERLRLLSEMEPGTPQ